MVLAYISLDTLKIYCCSFLLCNILFYFFFICFY